MKIPSPPLSSLAAVCAVVFAACSAVVAPALAQSDNFDDGNADGWTELAPLEAVPTPSAASFSFPGGNAYRMQSAASANEGAFGQARIGSLREDVTYEDFYVSVDIVAWDQSLDQNIGILARVSDAGLGTLDGYGVTYNPGDQELFFSVLTNEDGDTTPATDVPNVDPGEPVRMVFQGKGPNMKVELFTFDDLQNAVASIEMTDATYSSGYCGVFNVTDGADPPRPTDSTFDNYLAAAQEPDEFRVVDVRIEEGMVEFEFLSKQGVIYSIWKSGDLQSWEEIDDGIEAGSGTTTTYSIPMPAEERVYFQFRR